MRKIILLVLLASLALLPAARAQQPRGGYDDSGRYHAYTQDDGYYDRNGQWHPYTDSDRGYEGGYYDRNGQWHPMTTQEQGYYDRNGQWHPYTDRDRGYEGGYYDRDGQWHPSSTQEQGYYDRNGQWHPYSQNRGGYYDSYGHYHPYDQNSRAVGPDRWTFSDRGRNEALPTAARNFALTVASVDREAYRRSGYDDRAALEALRRLDQLARDFAAVTLQRNRPERVGQVYANLVDAFLDAQSRFGALQPDGWLANQFHVMAAAMGRLDKRYFGNRAFGGQNPGNTGYGYDRPGYEGSGYGYGRDGNPMPRGRATRPTRVSFRRG